MIQTDDSTLQKYLSSRKSMIDNNNKRGRGRKYRYRRKTKDLYHTEKKLRNKLKTTKISKQNIMATKNHYIRCSKNIPPRIYQKYLISRVSNQQKQKIHTYDAVLKIPSRAYQKCPIFHVSNQQTKENNIQTIIKKNL